MTEANEEYIRAVDRASASLFLVHVYVHVPVVRIADILFPSFLIRLGSDNAERLRRQYSELLRSLLDNANVDVDLPSNPS